MILSFSVLNPVKFLASRKSFKNLIMGRGIRHSKNRKKSKQDRPRKDRDNNGPQGYKEIVRENPLFQSFYKAQVDVCPPEEFDEGPMI